MQWEYRTIKRKATGFFGGKLDIEQLEKTMNDLGAQGWELVTAFGTNEGFGQTHDAVMIFKRETRT